WTSAVHFLRQSNCAFVAKMPVRISCQLSGQCILPAVTLSVVIITYNEEANIARMLKSVQPLVRDDKGEIIVVDSGSTDRTVEIAKSFGAKVFVEEWKGYAAQKNSAIEKASGDWILSLDADESLESELVDLISGAYSSTKIGSAEWCLTMTLAG